ncbi:MAG: hypothetical protein HC896_01035 [Bacteroidales bacterium]|nr:hypothetical protein [Bacteroidales bacterium]
MSSFTEAIDEVRLWNKALDQSGIAYNMDKSVNSNAEGLVLYFDFEHKSNNVYTDVSSYKNQGQNMAT